MLYINFIFFLIIFFLFNFFLACAQLPFNKFVKSLNILKIQVLKIHALRDSIPKLLFNRMTHPLDVGIYYIFIFVRFVAGISQSITLDCSCRKPVQKSEKRYKIRSLQDLHAVSILSTPTHNRLTYLSQAAGSHPLIPSHLAFVSLSHERRAVKRGHIYTTTTQHEREL